MLLHAHAHTIPAAYALLPKAMQSDAATAMLLAIGLQESKFEHRKQVRGPARGFYQFELTGVRGVLTHEKTEPHISRVLAALCYGGATTAECHEAITHNDVLATCFARLLLWSMPGKLPDKHSYEKAWQIYLNGWRPGRPHPETFPAHYGVAWDIVQP
jgi:hypothetical protein